MPNISIMLSNNVQDAVNEEISEYTLIFLSEISSFIFKDHNIDVSLYVLQADSVVFCMCSLGLSVDIVHSTTRSNLLVAVSDHMRRRRTHGKLHIHISQFGYIQEDRSLIDTQIDSKEMECPSKILLQMIYSKRWNITITYSYDTTANNIKFTTA